MRFIIRSAFWLTAAFTLIAPTVGQDAGKVASDTGARLAAQGTSLLSSGIGGIDCASIECTIGRAVVLGALPQTPSQSGDPMQTDKRVGAAPVPPPRPDWAS